MTTGTPLSAKRRKALLGEFVRGADLIVCNAEQLSHEAEVLRTNGSLARALFLHQISMEECAKVEMVGVWATAVLMGRAMNRDALAAMFRSHKAKNYENAHKAEIVGEELAALKRGDRKRAVEAFRKFQAMFHKELNTAKNASLYVDFKSGKFLAPTDVITEETVIGFWALNRHFLAIAASRLRLLKRFEGDDGFWEGSVKNAATRFSELIQSEDPELAMREFQEEIKKSFFEANARAAKQ